MIYNQAYQAEYQARENTEIGERIYADRWNFVTSYVSGGTLLDYGCATGAFHKRAPKAFQAKGYDINPWAGFGDLPHRVEILTMWDVIEHLVVPTEPITRLQPTWVFLSTPNIDACQGDVRQFKHWKPGEHLHYFNKKSLEAVLACAGYSVLGHNFSEGAIRDPDNPEAIISIVAKKDRH